MTEEEIDAACRLFAQFASFADEQGFDAVEMILAEVFE